MRHVPTSLYVDTEFFKRQRLRFGAKEFNAFTDTLAIRGLRLPVPAIMKRELFRHPKREGEKIADSVRKAHKTYLINILSLAGLPPKTN